MVTVEGLRKSYRKKAGPEWRGPAGAPGETVVIMGPSGCGKSTLIRCLNRLTEPDAGRIVLGGVEVTQLPHGGICWPSDGESASFSSTSIWCGASTALDNVSMGLRLHGINREEAEERAALPCPGWAWRTNCMIYPDEMSGGEQQRVSIARALALEPELMLWDEPTASLDPILVGEVLEVMENLVATGRTTMIVVTHELSFACRAADRVVLLDHGRIVEEGAPSRGLLPSAPRRSGKNTKTY